MSPSSSQTNLLGGRGSNEISYDPFGSHTTQTRDDRSDGDDDDARDKPAFGTQRMTASRDKASRSGRDGSGAQPVRAMDGALPARRHVPQRGSVHTGVGVDAVDVRRRGLLWTPFVSVTTRLRSSRMRYRLRPRNRRPVVDPAEERTRAGRYVLVTGIQGRSRREAATGRSCPRTGSVETTRV